MINITPPPPLFASLQLQQKANFLHPNPYPIRNIQKTEKPNYEKYIMDIL